MPVITSHDEQLLWLLHLINSLVHIAHIIIVSSTRPFFALVFAY